MIYVSCVPHLPVSSVRVADQVEVTVTLKDIFDSPVVNQSKHLEVKEREFLQNRNIEEDSTIYGIILRSVYWRGLTPNH